MSLNFDDVVFQLQELQAKMGTIEKERGNIPKAVSPFTAKVKATSRKFGRSWSPQALFGVHLGICVETRDPWKSGRIMVYCPIIHNIRNAKYLSESTLSWARPCSSFGSLDEVGSVFIPPEGSVILLMFEGGNRDSIYYMGSTWMPSRANIVNTEDDFTPSKETSRWQSVFPGIRESDVKTGTPNHLLPPWNNESYFGNDLAVVPEDGISAINTQNIKVEGNLSEERLPGNINKMFSTGGWRSADRPHMYGIKTPEKHFLLFDDGSWERENLLLGKRAVLQTSKGNVVFMKDDVHQTVEEIFKHKFRDTYNDAFSVFGSDQSFIKAFNFHAVELNHTGVQIQSFGGGRLIIDDKIKGDIPIEPFSNSWATTYPQGTQPLLRSMVRLESLSEHRVTLSDHNTEQGFVRSEKDGIFINTATGHSIQMQDHTDSSGKAGKGRKIHIESTSGHKIELKDFQCSITSPGTRATGRYMTDQRSNRDEGVYDVPNSKPDGRGFGEQVCMKFTSGFGQYLLFEDGSKQDSLGEQFLQLANSPGWNDPFNFLKMNQQTGDKLVHLRCAGERLTTVESNYTRVTNKNETLISKEGNQVHVVEEKNMIDVILKKNYTRFVKLGNDTVFVKNGRHITYAFQNTMHLCFAGPHLILGGVPPDGGEPAEGAAPVLLLGGDSPQNSHASKFLVAN